MYGFTRSVAVACGFLVSVIGLLPLWSWAVGHGAPTQLYLTTHIELDAALCFVAAGSSLVVLSASERPTWFVRIAQMPVLVPIALGIAGIAEHLSGAGFGVTRFFRQTFPVVPAGALRMGPAAALSFALIGVALLGLNRSKDRSTATSQTAVAVTIVLMMVPLVGYTLGIDLRNGLGYFTDITLIEAIAVTLLAIGTLAARPDAGLTRRFLAEDSGGMMLRRLLPAAIVLPVLLLRFHMVGEQAGLYGADFARAMLIVTFMVMFSTLIFLTAAALQRHTAARLRAEEAQIELRDKLAASLESERTARSIAERSNRVKEEFLATLSHELRTPLSAITGWVQLLMSGVLDDAEQSKALDTIERNSRLQAQLIEDLLEMSRIEAGTLRLDMHDVPLVPVIESAVAAAAPAAQANDLTLESRVSIDRPGEIVVRGDSARLQQIIANLIGNSIKFTSAGGRVTVTTELADGWVQVAVSDTGIGIRPEFLAHVFDRFRQADGSTTRKHGGLGLGLSIARQFVEMHGGTITAQSAGEGCGATFTVRLPTTAIADRPIRDAAQPAPGATRLDGLHILVVDDQRDACEVAERILIAYGARVTTVLNVRDALIALGERRFDAIVSDIGMPEQDGYDLIGRVRAKDLDVPAVALTAFARPSDVERAIEAGYQAHLSKPVTSEQLVHAVGQAIGARPARRETAVVS